MTLVPAATQRPVSLFITPDSDEGLSTSITQFSSAVYPTINRAIYLPVYLSAPITIKRLFCANGTVVSGTCDVGVYLPDAGLLPATRLISAGSTTQAGTSVLQFFDVTDTACPAGLIYLALSCSNTTATFFQHASVAEKTQRAWGNMMQDTAHPLPSPATPVTMASAYTPLIGIATTASP